MKISKLKKKTLKELNALGKQLAKMNDKMYNRFQDMLGIVDDAIEHVEALEIEKKNKKVKPIKIKLDTPKLPTNFEKEQKRKKKA